MNHALHLNPHQFNRSLASLYRIPAHCSSESFLRGRDGAFLREEDFFLEKELPLSRSPPKKAAWVFLSRRAKRAPGRMRLAGNDGAFLREEDFFPEKELPLSRSPQESRLGFPVPPRKARAGTDAPSRKRNKAASAAPFGRRMRPGGFLRRGVQGGTLPFSKGRVPPPGVTSPKS